MSDKDKDGSNLLVPKTINLAPLSPPNPPVTGSATGNPRNKTALQPGHSLMDWIRLTKSGRDLTGTGGKLLHVTPQELAKHNKRRDAWMAINGVVFNVTEYMDYHPGGWDELIRGAGKDATKMFNEIHRWVNYQSMLSACVVGKLAPQIVPHPAPKAPTNRPAPVIPPIVCQSGPEKPKLDWHQTSTNLTLSIYTRRKNVVKSDDVIVDYDDVTGNLNVFVMLRDDDTTYKMTYSLEDGLDTDDPFGVRVSHASGKIEIVLNKAGSKRWGRIGIPGPDNESWKANKTEEAAEKVYRQWKLCSRATVTRDVDHYVFEPANKSKLHFHVPCGHHISIRMDFEGTTLERRYTPTWENFSLNTTPREDESAAGARLHLLIKTYAKGSLTPLLRELPIGSHVDVSNPEGSFDADILGRFDLLLLLAAGTGLTPMLKVVRQFGVLAAAEKRARKAVLLFFNKTQDDIIWRRQLHEAAEHPGDYFTFKVHDVLSQEEGWRGHKGRISKELLERFLPEIVDSDNKMAFICGPIPFTKFSEKVLTENFNYNSSEIYTFEG